MTRTRMSVRLASPLLAAALISTLGCSGGGSGPRGSSGGSGGDEETGGSSGGGTGGKTTGTGGKAAGGSGGSGGSTGGAGGGDTGGAGGSGGATGGAGGSTGGSGGATGGAGGAMGGAGGAEGALTGNGCKGGTCLNPDCKPHGPPAAVGKFVSIGFEARPNYMPNDVLVPTFDDVPDRPYTAADGALYTNFGAGDWTKQMLDFLDANNLHVDFFINTNNFCDPVKFPACLKTIERIIKTQNVASHTVHHIHMGGSGYDAVHMYNSGCRATGTKLTCDAELMGVEEVVNMLSMGGIPHITRFRAPYGEPFQTGGANVGEIQGVVAKYAVHVGWAMESTDADHDDDGKALGNGYFIGKITSAIGSGPGAGSYGVILMHGTYPWSLGEVKGLLDPNNGEFKKRGFRVGTVEDAICWKYGKHSWELIQQINGTPHGPN
ncbi:MAG TPA: polysaccharide deacetylase family protein [Polyangia bacterium]|nr:polysaccharide deacetylase family protein [Polyangia bacterium]